MVKSQVSILINDDIEFQSVNDLYLAEVNYVGAEAIQVDLAASLYDPENEIVLYKGVLSEVWLTPNTDSISLMSLGSPKHTSIAFPMDSGLQKVVHKEHAEDIIPVGEYVLCFSVFLINSQMEIQHECSMIKVKHNLLDSLVARQLSRLTWQSLDPHVRIQTFTYFDLHPKSEPQSITHRNSGVYVSPTINILGYPISASFFLDTDSDFYYNSASTFQLSFDTQAYKTILAERLKAAAMGKTQLLGSTYTQAETLFKERDNIENMLQTTEVADLLRYADSNGIISQYTSDSVAFDLLSDQMNKYSDSAYLAALYDSLNCDSTRFNGSIQSDMDSLQQIKDSLLVVMEKVEQTVLRTRQYLDLETRQQAIDSLIMSDSTLAKAYDTYNTLNEIDVASYSDPDYIKQQLAAIDQLKKAESFISGVDCFQIGMSSPVYSEFSMTGVLLNGIQAAYDFGDLSIITADGRINDNSSLFTFDRYRETFSKLYSVGATYQIDSNLTYGIYVLASDFNNTDTLSYYNFLEENNVIAQTASFTSKGGKVQLLSELALSYARNADFGNLTEQVGQQAATLWPFATIAQQDDVATGMFTDKAAKLEAITSIDKGKTSLHMAGKWIGSGYYSPGNPFLINDLFSLEAGGSRNFYKNRAMLDLSIIRNQDNLSGLKEKTTAYYNLRSHLTLSIPSWPTIMVDYVPNVIINNAEQIQVNMLSGVSQYSYRVFDRICMLNANIMHVTTQTEVEGFSTNYSSDVYSVFQTLMLSDSELEMGWCNNITHTPEYRFEYQLVSLGYDRQFFDDRLSTSLGVQAVTESQWKVVKPGLQVDISGTLGKGLMLQGGYFFLPLTDVYVIAGTENLSNQTAYFTVNYQF